MNPIIICPKCNSSFREILDRLVRLTNEDIGKIDGMSVSNVKSISPIRPLRPRACGEEGDI